MDETPIVYAQYGFDISLMRHDCNASKALISLSNTFQSSKTKILQFISEKEKSLVDLNFKSLLRITERGLIMHLFDYYGENSLLT